MTSLIVNGQRWWTTQAAIAQLRVDRKRINDWVRRSASAGHTTPERDCQRCLTGLPGFPHVDPPVRRGRVSGYLADQLLDAELYTAGVRHAMSSIGVT